MRFKHLLLICFWFSSLQALSDQPMIPLVKAVVLLSDSADLGSPDLKDAEGLLFYEIKIPGRSAYLKEMLEPLFMDQPLTNDLIARLKEEIAAYYRLYGHPVVFVYVPEQDVSEGILQLVVIEARLDAINITGNKWFADRYFKRQVSLQRGELICADELVEDLAWMNRNPFRSVDAFFSPGQSQGTTDLELVVDDRFPVQVYVGGDNTGNEVTGHARWFGGITWGDAFFLDQMLTYQYTTASDPKRFQFHTLAYTMPLRWRHQLFFFGGYGTTRPDIGEDFTAHGTSYQASGRYIVPAGSLSCGTLHEWKLGFDFKHTNNNVAFVAEEDLVLITQPVNLTQFTIGYSYGKETESHRFLFEAEIYGSPAAMLPHQTNRRYDELTPGAKVRYLYGDLTISNLWTVPCYFSLFLQGRGQAATGSLLPSEEFGLGGYDTVRGYEEREFFADQAICFNAELRTPPVSFIRLFKGRCCPEDELTFLFFFDYGAGWLFHHPRVDMDTSADAKLPTHAYLMSVGPGLRYYMGRYISARADWGIRLHHNAFGDGARSMFHLGLVFSY